MPRESDSLRQATVKRKTQDPDISATVNLDGSGVSDISTAIGFLDHMLDQLARHSLMDITVKANGEAYV